MFRGHGCHQGGKTLEITVAGIMAVCVVDGFKMIQIEHDNGTNIAGGHFMQEIFRQLLKIAEPIQPGQCIMGIFIMHLPFLSDVFCHIEDNTETAFG